MMVFRRDLFKDKVVIVTGGGTGIGKSIARSFGELGARVVITSRKEEHFLSAREALEKSGIDCLALRCDIREIGEVESLVDSVIKNFGKIDVLVNNAGGQFPSPAENITPKGWAAVINNNLNGTFNVTLTVANKWMIPQSGGKIINIVANMWRGFPGLAHTGAARAGVANLTMTLAVEWARHKITINAVAPGTIATEGLRVYPREIIESQRSVVPLKRFGRPADVSQLVLFLASPAGDYITGAIVPVDGGERLWSSIWQIPDDEEAKKESEKMLEESSDGAW
ncbi:MAG: SDR family oxidoreductase [Deltaproteobacteria bacterium]|nr:SDR family oxidoreductase [Deltaproteobacteria bacterium]